jgi:tetratricopeptide (TPR) repeat protein
MGTLGWSDHFDAFEALQGHALADARRRGSVIGFATAMYGLNFSHYYRGMLADAVADAEQAIAAERAGWRHFLTAARAQLAWALIELGELDAAAHQLDRARNDNALEQTSAHALVLEARARIELVRGVPRRALESALAAGRVFAEARIPNPSIVPWRSRAAIAAGAIGDRELDDGKGTATRHETGCCSASTLRNRSAPRCSRTVPDSSCPLSGFVRAASGSPAPRR